ncbi:hypothetical protein EG328_006162 [Venturia inaequalis]|uniref:Uncharacterized protein n=1 Tax=Venturia inaequalis TaxID=5025 RepID=A0A8H3UJX8_VENIN|nr:hypothetical protein EG328_006162 [Venturia inaequalis]
MRPSLLPLIAILAAQASSAVTNSTALSSSLLNQAHIWYSRGLLRGNLIICSTTIKGQEWILTTIVRNLEDNHLGESATLVLKEVYPVKDGNAIVGRFSLVERDVDFGAVIAPFVKVG